MQYAINHATRLSTVDCCNCGITFAMPSTLLDRFKNNGNSFYCPHGHGQSFTKSEVDRLREKLDEQTRTATEMADRARDAEAAATKAKQTATKARSELKRVNDRINAGVCPCCNRTFKQLARHMKTKHPDAKP